MFTIDFEESFDQLPLFVLNILKLCTDTYSDNEITNSSGYIFDRLIQYFINLDSKSIEYDQIFFFCSFNKIFFSNKKYTSNVRLCIVHILNAIELSPELGVILLRTFKVEVILEIFRLHMSLLNRKFRVMMYRNYSLHFVLHLSSLCQKIEQSKAK